MGIQDASIKVEHLSLEPEPCAGTVTNTEGGVHGLVLKMRVDKTWLLIEELVGMEREGRYGMSIARMESIIWFLVYVSIKYKNMTPYPKGFHLTIYSWRPYEDEEGWRLQG